MAQKKCNVTSKHKRSVLTVTDVHHHLDIKSNRLRQTDRQTDKRQLYTHKINRFHTGSSRRITLIFDIFRIGLVISYRGGMLNLYSVYSASNVCRLCALLCPAISFLQFHVLQFHVLHFHVLHFHVRHFHVLQFLMSCNFMSCKLVLQFHVLQFHALHIGPSISCPAISCPANWSINFMSCNFTSSILSAPVQSS